MLAALKPFANLISICGGLLIFFSWLVTSTLGEQLKAAKAEYETASDKRRLYHTLDEIRQSTESVASAVINLHIETVRLGAMLNPRRDQQAAQDAYQHNELLYELASIELNARQIDWGDSFCRVVLYQPEVDSGSSPAQELLSKNCAAIGRLADEKKALIERMRANLNRYSPSSPASLEDVAQTQRKLDDALKALLPSFGPLLESATEAANAREDELRKGYRRAKARFALADQTSIYLYILGTVIVLIGTALDKLVK